MFSMTFGSSPASSLTESQTKFMLSWNLLILAFCHEFSIDSCSINFSHLFDIFFIVLAKFLDFCLFLTRIVFGGDLFSHDSLGVSYEYYNKDYLFKIKHALKIF